MNAQSRANITVMEAAIGSASGFVSVLNEGMGWAARTEKSDAGVRMITIDEAVATVANGELFLVKVDIEGFESDLFAENLDWIGRAHTVINRPRDWMLPGQRTSGSFQRAMAAHEFEMFFSGENLVYVRI